MVTKTYTIEEFITVGTNRDINYDTLSIFDKSEGVVLNTYNILNDYSEEINNLVVNIQMNDEEYYKYAYKPKLLAYDIYGSSELHFIILFINNICSVKEFNTRKVKMIKKDDLVGIISSIMSVEEHNIRRNRNKIEI